MPDKDLPVPCVLTRGSWANSHDFVTMENWKFTQLFNIKFNLEGFMALELV